MLTYSESDTLKWVLALQKIEIRGVGHWQGNAYKRTEAWKPVMPWKNCTNLLGRALALEKCLARARILMCDGCFHCLYYDITRKEISSVKNCYFDSRGKGD